MKISYAITVSDELEEIKTLLDILLIYKRDEDEIVILLDDTKTNNVKDYLLFHPYNTANKPTSKTFFTLYLASFTRHFAEWKNCLNDSCTGDYIFNIDADEYPSKTLIQNIHLLIESNLEVDLFYVPRINTVKGITKEHLQKWGWNMDAEGRINYPDYQGRIYRRGLKWQGKVHEQIVGAKTFTYLPEGWELNHPKNIEKQERQNNYYNTL